MSVKLTGYINLNGNAKDALAFYKDVFGGEVYSDTFKEFNDKSDNAMPAPEEDNDKVMHGSLTGGQVELMVSDTPSTWPPSPTTSNIVLALNGNDEATLRGYWEKLAKDGMVTQPLEAAPWGDIFGSLTDKFGVNWMVDIEPAK